MGIRSNDLLRSPQVKVFDGGQGPSKVTLSMVDRLKRNKNDPWSFDKTCIALIF